MRFLSLGLDRYGRFTDRRIDFDPTARVVVVVGSNEAGKSTALAAATDVLFGIEERSRFNFLHDYKSMRLSATIVGGDGRPLTFSRLKRRQSALIDPGDDSPLPDDVLAPFLGAHDRHAFRAIYGLDQEALREGGAKLLAGGGDLADTLLAAAPGLSRVAALRDAMRASAADVFNPDRANAKHAFYMAVARFKEAEKARQDTELRRETVAGARAEAEAAAKAREDAIAAERMADAEARQAVFLREAARDLRLIALAETELETLGASGPLPVLEAAFPEAARRRLEAHERAHQAEAEAEGLALQARTARDAIAVDEAVLARADAVTALDEARAQVEDKLLSLPNRRREAEDARAALSRVAAGLGLDGADGVRRQLPGPPVLARAQKLVDQLREHGARWAGLEEEAATLDRRRREAEGAAQADHSPEDPAPLKLDLDALDGAETRADHAERLAQRLETSRESLKARLARLIQASGVDGAGWSLETLRHHPLPDAGRAETLLARLSRARDGAERCQEAVRELSEEMERLRARQLALEGPAGAPTGHAIAAAREARDGLWQTLRPIMLAQRPVRDGDGDTAFAFERAAATADRLADERQTESQRLAELARIALDLADRGARATAARTRAEEAEAMLAAVTAEWAALWQGSGLPATADSITLVRALETVRTGADDLLSQDAEARRAAEAARWDRTRAEALRATLGLPPLGDAPLRMADLRAAIAVRERAFQLWREHCRELERLDRDATAHATRRAALEGQRASLTSEAADLFPPLAIRPQAHADEARAALDLWQEATHLATELQIAERRIAGIEQDEGRFAAAVEALLAQLPSAPAENLFAAVRALRRRLDAARQAKTSAEAADARLAERAEASATARAALEQARRALAETMARAQVTEATALPQQLDRLEAAGRLMADMEAARLRLNERRGTRELAAIRAEIATRDDDALARHVTETETAREAAREARDAAIERATRALAAQEALNQQAGAADAAQAAQDAISNIGAAMERFTRGHVAARLLAVAVERYREAHQSPIVSRASSAFATLTDGRWSGIDIDYDCEPPRLAAMRDGRPHDVDALSEGTADQLFLAVRVAAIEEHARRATPLPFLADDLFMTFDEGRTEAGLRLLAELGAVTQVIVFTHHSHVATCAHRALGSAAAVVEL